MPRSKIKQLQGGLADNLPDELFDPKQLKMGIKIEMEHTNCELIAKKIAKDHLVENEKYYTYLKKMEKQMEKDKKKGGKGKK